MSRETAVRLWMAPLRDSARWLLEAVLVFLTSGAVVFFLGGLWLSDWPGNEAGTVGHGVVLAAEIAAWGIIGAAELLVLSRLKAGHWAVPGIDIQLLAAAGILIAAALEFAIHEWARVRFGAYDPEYVGVTAVLPELLLLLVLLGYQASAIAGHPPLGFRLAAGLCGLTVIGIFAVNGVGLHDGIMPGSELLAGLVALATVYALPMLWRAARPAMSRKSGPARGR
jgi:hypothetical protein